MTTENNNTPKPEANTGVQAQEQKTEVQIFKEKQASVAKLLDSCKEGMLEALPKFLTPDRMVRVMLTAMSNTPKLLDCTRLSLVSSLMTCGQLGLLPDPVLGEVYLIPFNNTRKQIMECQVIVGYKGLSTLAMRSGFVSKIQPKAVYEGDHFEYEFGLNETLQHKPGKREPDAKIMHFYCIITMKDGTKHWDVMSRAQIEAIRDDSANYKFARKKEETIWGKYFEEMGNKTVLRRLMKYVPLSPELQKAIALDESADAGKQKLTHSLVDFGGQVTEDAIAEIVTEGEDKVQEQREDMQEDAANKGNAATQAALNLMEDAKTKKQSS